MLKGSEESNTYLTQVCRHPRSGEKMKYEELLANTVAIDYH